MKIRDLKEWHIVFFEIGLILSLLFLLAAFTTEFKAGKKDKLIIEKDPDPIQLEDIPVTKDPPAAPPKPEVLQPVPNHTPVEDLPDLSEIVWEPGNHIPLTEVKKQEEDNEAVPFVKAEKKPELAGGMELLYQKISYPRKAIVSRVEGTVIAEFTVKPDGSIQDLVITRGIGAGCDEEVRKALQQSTFRPGMQRGVFVPVRMKVSVVFKLR